LVGSATTERCREGLTFERMGFAFGSAVGIVRSEGRRGGVGVFSHERGEVEA